MESGLQREAPKKMQLSFGWVFSKPGLSQGPVWAGCLNWGSIEIAWKSALAERSVRMQCYRYYNPHTFDRWNNLLSASASARASSS